MIRDNGPRNLLGYGTIEPGYDVSETGVNPESGVIAKALGGHPIASFLAVSAASMVGMTVASGLIRKGGIRFGKNILARDAARSAGQNIAPIMFGGRSLPQAQFSKVEQFIASSAKDIRDLRKLVNEWETETVFRGIPVGERNLEFSLSEIQEARRLGRNIDPMKTWTMRDEMKSRLLRQAKTLPYTLPGIYITDRMLVDPLMGKKSDVNWYNPIDVLGDFAIHSVKSLSTMMIPWDLGSGAARHGWEKFRLAGKSYIDGGAVGNLNVSSQLLNRSLERIGQSAGDLVSRGGMRGAQFLHAYSMGAKSAQFHQLELTRKNVSEAGREANRVMSKLLTDPRSSFTAADFDSMRKVTDLRLPGGFGGAHSFFKGFRDHWKLFGSEIAAGNTGANLSSRFINSTKLDDILESIQIQTGNIDNFGRLNNRGDFIQNILKSKYKSILAQELTGGNIDPRAARKVADLFSMYALPTKRDVKDASSLLVSQRIKFTDRLSMDDPEALVQELISPLARIGSRKITNQSLISAEAQAREIVKRLKPAIQSADKTFVNNRQIFTNQAQSMWGGPAGLFPREVMPYIEQSLGTSRLPYNLFSKPFDQATGHHVISILAKEKGISGIYTKSIDDIQKELLDAGIDINNLERVRAYLSTKHKITKPWQEEGYNAFGFKKVTLDELAGERSYYNPTGVAGRSPVLKQMWENLPAAEKTRYQTLLNELKHTDNYSDSVGFLKQINLGSVWINKQGNVVNLSPFRNAMRVFANTMADFSQIPLLHINPMKLGFFDVFRAFGQQRGITSLTAEGSDMFTHGQRPSGVQGYMHFQQGRKSYAVSFGSKIGERFSTKVVPTEANSILGNYLRNAIGDPGIAYDRQYLERSKFRQAFDIDRDQASSIFRWTSRFKDQIGYQGSGSFGDRVRGFARALKNPNAKGNWDNPTGLAKWISEQGDDLASAIDNLSPEDQIRFARSFNALMKETRAKGTLSPNLISRLSQISMPPGQRAPGNLLSDSPWGDLFNVESSHLGSRQSYLLNRDGKPRIVRNAKPGLSDTFEEMGDFVNLLDTEGYDVTLRRIGHEVASNMPAELSQGASGGLSARGFAQEWTASRSRLRYLRSSRVDPYSPTGTAYRQAGIATRQQEYREELYRVLISDADLMHRVQRAGGVLDPNNLEEPGEMVRRLLNIVENQKDSLNPQQYRELRMAALSIQAEQLRVFYNTTGLLGRATKFTPLEQTLQIAKSLGKNNMQDFQSIADFSYRVSGNNIWDRTKRQFLTRFSSGQPSVGSEYNPFGGDTSMLMLPTFRESFKRSPLGATKSSLGFGTWNDSRNLSVGGIYASHFVTRLNRYFGTFGLGLDEAAYNGPLDLFARGMVGKRVLPAAAAGATVYGVDATLGGLFNKDDQGNRIYSPLFLGMGATALAHTQAALSGIVPGGKTYEEKRQEIFEGEVPVRKGRWWLLGNTPFEGGRIMYYRPSWYRRFKSGSQYTGQLWDNPAEKLFFGYDFSPGKWIPGLNYHWERKHYKDRPYPVTGEMFTGPWGPLTGFLNSTIGRILKPPIRMHRDEVSNALANYGAMGEFGMVPLSQEVTSSGGSPIYVNDRGRMRIGGISSAAQILGMSGSNNRSVSGPIYADQGMSRAQLRSNNRMEFWGSVATTPFARQSYPQRSSNVAGYGMPQIMSSTAFARSGYRARTQIDSINEAYTQAAKEQLPLSRRRALAVPYYTNTRYSLRSDVIPNVTPRTSGDLGVTLGQFGYELQEMAGIYGFAFGSLREAFGLGKQDFTPRKPILTAASRAYGSERGFWDLQLGGLGDLPTPLEGDYSNLELSEIVRRFIPHRRRDIQEINPIPNLMGKQYPWLPGSNYFVNFKEGDPYTLIGEGELRLPGVAYERLNKLHPDATGNYGLIDQFKILGDIAPWSDEYRSLARIVSKMKLSPEEQEIVTNTRRQVASRNKVKEFSRYKYAHQNFDTETVTISGRVEGKADQFYTEEYGDRPVRLAGVRARSQEAQDFMDSILSPGQKVSIKTDANAPYSPTIDAVMKTSSGLNINNQLAQSGYAFESELRNPIDIAARENPHMRPIKALFERIGHADTFINSKFFPNKTASEDWERNYVYGSTFSQWQHPYRDFIKPMVFRASMRNPVAAAVTMGFVSRMFFKEKTHKSRAAAIGAAIGATASVIGHLRNYITGEPFIPEYRVKELAVEEYADILNYVKYSRLYGQARLAAVASGEVDPELLATKAASQKTRGMAVSVGEVGTQALQFRKEIQRTMYGADPFADVTDLMMAIPKRKREHFQEMLNAPVNERKRVLATAGRLERRILQARWGMAVEKRPDLEEYFADRELPPPEWEGYSPGVDMEMVKIKIMQHQGLDMSQIGYYPQQVNQANLINMSYPDFNAQSSERNTRRRLNELMNSSGVLGTVMVRPNMTGRDRIELNLGVEY